jgi:organic radical activating enzyme
VYRINEIFYSLQGEGYWTGTPMVFLRFSGCNLACKWCDTHKDERMSCTAEEIVKKVGEHSNKSVIITGGEPTVQRDLDVLVRELKDAGYWVALETNGVRAPACAELFDYIAVSPKPDYFSRYMDNLMIREANEVRIVATTDEIVGFCRSMRARIKATDYYISPLEMDGKMHYRRALNLLMKLKKGMPDAMPPWSLSIQMHKVIGIR